MPTSADPLLLDTSAAIALVQPRHTRHRLVRDRVRGRSLGLSGHAELVELGLAGGSTYDALVGLAARHHDLTLLSTDARAAATYRLLGIDFAVV